MYQTAGTYETYVKNLKPTTGKTKGIALSEDQYNNAVQEYGVDIVNNMYSINGKHGLYPSYVKSNPNLGWNPWGGWDLTSNLQNVYSNIEDASDAEKEYWSNYNFNTKQAEDFSGFEGRKYKIVMKDGKQYAVLNTDNADEGDESTTQGGIKVVDNDVPLTNPHIPHDAEWPQWLIDEHTRELQPGDPGYGYYGIDPAKWMEFGEGFNRKTFTDKDGIMHPEPLYNYKMYQGKYAHVDKDGNYVGTTFRDGTPYPPYIMQKVMEAGSYNLLDYRSDDVEAFYDKAQLTDNVIKKYVPGAALAGTAGKWLPGTLRSIAGIGEATYGAVAPYTSATIGGIPGLTIGNLANAAGISYGTTHLPKDLGDFVENPSLGGAGNIGMDVLGMFGIKNTPRFNIPKIKTPKVKTHTDGPRGTILNKYGQVETSITKNLTTKQIGYGPTKAYMSTGKIKIGKQDFPVSYQTTTHGPHKGLNTVKIGTSADKGGYVQLDYLPDTKMYQINMGMPNQTPLLRGRAMEQLLEFIPKGSKITSDSYSIDSYRLFTGRIASGKYKYINTGKHSSMNSMGIEHEGTTGLINLTESQAVKAVDDINQMLKKANIKDRAFLETDFQIQNGREVFFYDVKVPHLAGQLLYRDGGFRKLSPRRPRTF